MTLPFDAHFGNVSVKSDAWKELPEDDPDDEELEETPEDIIELLGFDPKKE